jgi:hypothetical protein
VNQYNRYVAVIAGSVGAVAACGAMVATRVDGGVADGGLPDTAIPDSGELDPQGIFGGHLAVWLDADEPSTVFTNIVAGVSRVWRWADRTPNRTDAIASYAWWTDVAKPPASLNDVAHIDYVTLGAHHALRFPGSANSNVDGATLVAHINVDAFVLVLIGSYTNIPAATDDGGWGAFFRISAPNGSSPVGLSLGGNAYGAPLTKPNSVIQAAITNGDTPWYRALSAANGWNDGKPHALATRWDGSTLTLRTDGMATNVKASASSFGNVAQLGGEYRGPPHLNDYEAGTIYAPLDGYICEVIIVKGTGTDEQFNQLAGYVQRKYGLPL